jgi:hypothetical protein
VKDRTHTFLAVALALVVAASRLPALLLAANDERLPDRVFLGFEADAATAVDLHYYASYVAEAREDPKLLLTDRATTETQHGRILSLYLLGLGLLSRVTGLSIPATWNLARVLMALLFFWLLWGVLRLFFPEPGRRLLAFALVAVGGGLGWLMLVGRGVFGESEALHLADLAKDGVIGYSTFGYLYHPQAMAGQTCFLGAILLWARWRETRRLGWLVAALVCAALIFAVHGPSAPVFYLALVAAPLVPLFFRFEARAAWDRLRAVAPFLLPAALAAAYVLWAREDPVYRGFADTYAQLHHLREPFFWYPVGYGVIFFLALLGLPRAGLENAERRDLLLGWTLAALLASLNPLFFAWKFQFALHVPLCILATHGASFAWQQLTRARCLRRVASHRGVAALCLVGFTSLSSLLLFAGTLARATHDTLYASQAELEAFAFLARNPPGHLLGRYRTGYLAIHLTPHKAFLAHYTGTLDPARKDALVQAFFRGEMSLERKRRFLEEEEIRYVYWGPRERELGSVDPALGLRPVYERGGVTVYEVSR